MKANNTIVFAVLSLSCFYLVLDNKYGKKLIDKFVKSIVSGESIVEKSNNSIKEKLDNTQAGKTANNGYVGKQFIEIMKEKQKENSKKDIFANIPKYFKKEGGVNEDIQ